MTIELDHLFICSKVNAPEIQPILDLGLSEGRPNIHPGQGTANKCIFWQNFMLELLFVIDKREISSSIITPTRLKERCNYYQTGYSPFGIAFRREESDQVLPFSTWAYKPPYLSDYLQIDIAQNTKPHEPLIFVVPWQKEQARKPINHPARIQHVTSVQINIPSTEPFSEAIDYLNRQSLVKFVQSSSNLVSLECDRSAQNQAQDFRPNLPLMLRW